MESRECPKGRIYPKSWDSGIVFAIMGQTVLLSTKKRVRGGALESTECLTIRQCGTQRSRRQEWQLYWNCKQRSEKCYLRNLRRSEKKTQQSCNVDMRYKQSDTGGYMHE